MTNTSPGLCSKGK